MNKLFKLAIILILTLSLISSISITFLNNVTLQASAALDSDKDGLDDNQEDLNSNGIVEDNETDPHDPDTDKDGYSDGVEKTSGKDPLDFNSIPIKYPKEIDTNNDGTIDNPLTNTQFLSQYNLQKVEKANISTTATCNTTIAKINKDYLDCRYYLQSSIANNSYTFGSDDFRLRPSTSKYETRCNLEDNNTPKPYILCTSVKFSDASIGEDNMELLYIIPDGSTVILNQDIKVEFIIDPASVKVIVLTSEIDFNLERTCEPQLSGQSTTCKFKLPKNVILPQEYMMGIGVAPAGYCAQQPNSLEVLCTDVPTGNSRLATSVNTTLSQNLPNLATILGYDENMHEKLKTQQISSIQVIEKSKISNIQLTTAYTNMVNLNIYDKSGVLLQTLPGMIGTTKVFNPIGEVNYSDKLSPGKYDAVIEAPAMNALGQRLIVKFILEVLPNNPQSQIIINTNQIKGGILTRTGGVVNVEYIMYGLLAVLLILIIYKNRRYIKTSSVVVIALIMLGGNLVVLNTSAQVKKENLMDAAFSSISCPVSGFKFQSITCTLKVKDITKIPKNSSVFIFYEGSDGVKVETICDPYSVTEWSCSNLQLIPDKNFTLGTFEFTIKAGITANPMDIPEVGFVFNYLSSFSTQTSVVEKAAVGTGFFVDIKGESIYQIGVGETGYFKFNGYRSPTYKDPSIKIFAKISNDVTGALLTTVELIPDKERFSFNGTIKPNNANLWRLEFCYGTVVATCKNVERDPIKIEVIPLLNVKPLFDSTDAKKDRVNVVFECDRTFITMESCIKTSREAFGIEGNPVPVNPGGTKTDPLQTVSLAYPFFANHAFRGTQDKFNFWYIDALIPSVKKEVLVPLYSKVGIDPKTVILLETTRSIGRSFAYLGFKTSSEVITKADINYTDLSVPYERYIKLFYGPDFGEFPADFYEVVNHEMGHAMFGLADEYVEVDKSKPLGISNPNCMTTVEGAKTLWTKLNNGVDPNGSLDSYYNTWINEYKNYSYNKVSLFNQLVNVPNSNFDPGLFTVNYKNFGGCYIPEGSPSIIRPTKDSMMNSGRTIWGTVNRNRVENVLSLFSGKASCTNGFTNYPTCAAIPVCSNQATNPPACTEFKPCTNGKTNPPKCDTLVIPPCSNKAINPPTCNNFGPTEQTCPTGTGFDKSIGFCADATKVYGFFPKAIIDKCVAQFPKDLSCTATTNFKFADKSINIQIYDRARFVTYRGTGECPFGTKKDASVGNLCVEFDIKTPSDLTKANVYGPFTKKLFDSCIANKGGGGCYSNRFSYNFFKSINK